MSTPHREHGAPRVEPPTGSAGAPERRILLVDCDSFYVQVARLEDPEGVGKEPLLVVGGSPSGRGVVTSASYAVREYGVRSGMPASQAIRLCPELVIASVPRKAISRHSRAVRGTLEALSPVVQAASVDEFYLDLTGTERLFGRETLEETAWRIRETVLDETGISVSIGGSTQAMLAKMASGMAKPGGVHIVPAGGEAAFMRQFDLADLPGVGPALVAGLRKRGLVRVEDILPVDEDFLVEWFGESRGRWLYRRARGIDSRRVTRGANRKSISAERTFSRDVDRTEELEALLLKLTRSVTRTLRREGRRVRTVTVKIRDDDFTTRQASRTLPSPLETDSAVFAAAVPLLRELRGRRARPVRLLGVGLTNFAVEGETRQLGLFDLDEGPDESERARALSRTVDQLTERFGDDAVRPGRVLPTTSSTRK
jgi:DNA polymerase-4